jgi:hypothetical protein
MYPAILVARQSGLLVLSSYPSIEAVLNVWASLVAQKRKPVRLLFGTVQNYTFTVDIYDDLNGFVGDPPPRTISNTQFSEAYLEYH